MVARGGRSVRAGGESAPVPTSEGSKGGRRAALVVPYYDAAHSGGAAATLRRFAAVPELAAELRRLGWEVEAFHLARNDAMAAWRGVRHRFVATGPLRRAVARAADAWARRHGPAYYDVAPELTSAVFAFRPDVVHVFGLGLDIPLAHLAAAARRRGVPVVVQFHGAQPAGDAPTRALQRFALRHTSRVLFTHPAQAEPWRATGWLRPDQVAIVIETSVRTAAEGCAAVRPDRQTVGGQDEGAVAAGLVMSTRAFATGSTGSYGAARSRGAPRVGALDRLEGMPAIAMVGRLHPLKDPITALAAFARVGDALPAARLHLFGASDALGGRLRRLVEAAPVLSGRVVFHGYTKSARLAALLPGAHFLLQASRREWSGLSVIEALAAGVVPVVTDIPAFRALTDDGRVARLAPPGDDRALAEAILSLWSDPAAMGALRAAGRDWFARGLSFAAQARAVAAVYGTVIAESGTTTRRASASTTPPATSPDGTARSPVAAS